MTTLARRSRSSAEDTLAVQLEQAGIPFEREYRFASPRRWRADFCITSQYAQCECPQHKWLVEIDGGGYIAGRHSRGRGMELDAEKQSAAAILGYRVIRCVPAQVENGVCLEWIRQALGLEAAAWSA